MYPDPARLMAWIAIDRMRKSIILALALSISEYLTNKNTEIDSNHNSYSFTKIAFHLSFNKVSLR